MGYEMYRLLNYASDANVKTPRKKPKENDDDSSSNDDKEWKKKATKTKADLAMIEKYRKIKDSLKGEKKQRFLFREISPNTWSRFNCL
jgi:hypothetical protein